MLLIVGPERQSARMSEIINVGYVDLDGQVYNQVTSLPFNGVRGHSFKVRLVKEKQTSGDVFLAVHPVNIRQLL